MRIANKGSFKSGNVNQYAEKTSCFRGHELTQENFRIRTRNGRTQRICLACRRISNKLWLKSTNRVQKENERSKKKDRDLHAKVISVLGGKCVCCGETDVVFLAADHINGGGSKHRKEMSGRKIWRQIVNNPEVRKLFQCLCHNCNMAKHIIGYCPHELKILRFVEAA